MSGAFHKAIKKDDLILDYMLLEFGQSGMGMGAKSAHHENQNDGLIQTGMGPMAIFREMFEGEIALYKEHGFVDTEPTVAVAQRLLRAGV